MKNKEKHLKNADVILNLDEININDLDSFWSASGIVGTSSPLFEILPWRIGADRGGRWEVVGR